MEAMPKHPNSSKWILSLGGEIEQTVVRNGLVCAPIKPELPPLNVREWTGSSSWKVAIHLPAWLTLTSGDIQWPLGTAVLGDRVSFLHLLSAAAEISLFPMSSSKPPCSWWCEWEYLSSPNSYATSSPSFGRSSWLRGGKRLQWEIKPWGYFYFWQVCDLEKGLNHPCEPGISFSVKWGWS